MIVFIDTSTQSSESIALSVGLVLELYADSSRYARQSAKKLGVPGQGRRHSFGAKNVAHGLGQLITSVSNIVLGLAHIQTGKEPLNGSKHPRPKGRPVCLSTMWTPAKSFDPVSAKNVDLTPRGLRVHTSTTTKNCGLDGCASHATSDGTKPVQKKGQDQLGYDLVTRWEQYTGKKAELLTPHDLQTV